MPMQPIHRLACLAQRPDGAAEWACPGCGRYLVNYPDKQVVLAAGAPDIVHVSGPGYPADRTDVLTVTDFDEQFLQTHAIAW